jgi:AraC-like DNA-binding protein
MFEAMQDQLSHLRALAARHATGRRTDTALPRVVITSARGPTSLTPGVYEPMFCLILQGAKEVMIADRVLRYDPACYFIASIEVPASARIVQASPDKPYIGVSLGLDREGLAALLPDIPPAGRVEAEKASFGVSPVTPSLLDPWLRLLSLLDAPKDIPVMAPLLEREILYRLLQGPLGHVLRQIALADSRLSQIRRAIGWIRAHYDEPLRVDTLVDLAGMSAASFHRHFKAATAMSPLQYQKTLRLQQARRLLIANQDAAQAGYAVGYESASQFSREYARLFGAPPVRDALRLRADGGALAEGVGVA